MTQLSAQDKLQLATFLSSSTVELSKLQAALPLAGDDGLKKWIEGSISATEAQIKSVQEFCQSHGLS